MSAVAFSKRRAIGIFVLVLASTAAVLLWLAAETALVRDVAVGSGIALLSVCLLLTLFNARKKVPFLPVLSGAAWLQFHIYAGLFSGVLFLVHICFRLPTGYFEWALALVFVGVFASGLVGLWLTRRLPRRLTRRGEQVIFERIPALRLELMHRAEAVVERGVEESGARSVADFYERELRPFFLGTRNFLEHCLHSNAPRHRVLSAMSAFERYVGSSEREVMNELRALVEQKDDLDYQHAGQTILKMWLFVHIPLTFSLLVLAGVHVVLVAIFQMRWLG